MLRNILVGLDGSDYCRKASKEAMTIAKNFNAKLFGLGIIDAPAIFDPSPGVAGSIHYKEAADKAQYEKAQKRIGDCLNEFASNCRESQVSFEIGRNEGSPLEEFLKEAVGYDVIIFGQKTYFEHGTREGPGDTLVRLLKDTPRPVVVIPKDYKYNNNDPAVMAFDGSIPSARAMQLFTLLSYDDPVNKIHLVTVSDEEEEGHARQANASLYLERWYGQKPINVVLKGKRSEAIQEYALKVRARMIIMGAYGVSGLKTLFFGSVTRDILKSSKTMLFLYH